MLAKCDKQALRKPHRKKRIVTMVQYLKDYFPVVSMLFGHLISVNSK